LKLITARAALIHLVSALALAAAALSDPAAAQARKKIRKVALTEASAADNPAQYQSRPEVQAFIASMAQKHGFVENELRFLFSRARFYPNIIELITPPTNPRVRSWQAYRSRFIEPVRIAGGVELWKRHAKSLARAELEYGVPAEIIVAIIGVETVYGRNVGSFRVIDALTTLAFDYPRRADYFRDELENYLLFAREEGLDIFALKGSYAGAIGIPQFMPSSWRAWAVDFDGDGKIDLRNNFADAIGSVGNFLKGHGWVAGAPIAFPAQLEGNAWRGMLEQDITPSVKIADLPRLGVVSGPLMKQGLPGDTLVALVELVTPDQPAEYWVGLQNFYVITRYNRSSFYAMSVLQLAGEVKAARETSREISRSTDSDRRDRRRRRRSLRSRLHARCASPRRRRRPPIHRRRCLPPSRAGASSLRPRPATPVRSGRRAFDRKSSAGTLRATCECPESAIPPRAARR
jgi:membrane-bound lytic murein transglycosylase B